MTITAIKSDYNQVLSGPDWTLYSDVNFKDTAIIHELYKHIKNNADVSYSGIAELLRSKKREKTVKSDCMIFESMQMIEVTKPRGGFPRFYILRNLDK
jgi:uncharacterized protein YcbK (DUF882 family)